jgi:phenylacetate-CoA ligase
MPIPALTAKLKRLEMGERFVRRNPFYYSAVERELSRLEAADGEARARWCDERVKKILSSAAHTAYGRSVGAPRALAQWPLLGKESVRDNPDAFVRNGTWSGQWFNAHATTGGTTGVPLKLVRSPESVVAEQACQDRAIAHSGIDPRRARIAVLRADDVKNLSDQDPPYWIYALGGRRLIFSSNHLTERTLPHFVQELRAFAPDVLWVYPTPLESLCLLLEKTGTELRVPRVLSSSEVLQPEVWRLAERTLGCKVIDRYGQAERVACAHAFAPGEYCFVPGYAHIELIESARDEDTVLYEIVGTSLWNTAMPLVRYRTGDLVRLPTHYGANELREIANGTRSFEGVIGRSNEVLLAPGGAGVLTGINHLPRGVPNLVRLQVAQERPDLIVLRVLAASGFGPAEVEQLMRNARLKIPEAIDVRVEVCEALERTKGGKTPYVVHGPKVKEALQSIRGLTGEQRRGVA